MLVSDHLPGGVNDNPSAPLEIETGSAPKVNVISECDFAQLDRLLREKPNASTLPLEAMVLRRKEQLTKEVLHNGL